MTSARVRRLTLNNFRNYHAAALEADAKTIVLVGPNGAGKTNLIEAISFFAPGRGLRRATLDEVAFSEGDGSWAVAAEIEGALGLATLGTGIERPVEDGATTLRKYRIDREPVASAAAFADHLRVVWLIPAMDALFTGAPSERRRFLDRLVLAVDAEHGSRVNALERSLRSRNRLLEEPRPDRALARRRRTRDRRTRRRGRRTAGGDGAAARKPCWQAARARPSRAAEIALDGWMEQLIPGASRRRDRGALPRGAARQSRTRCRRGPHARRPAFDRSQGRSMRRKASPAADASTGEQKALLIGLVLAHARLIAEMTGISPILLLDEVVAHLDPARRAALHAELAQLDSQVWMTGADPALFAEIDGDAEMVEVSSGRLRT